MDRRRTDWTLQDINRGTVLAAVALMAIGALLGLAGISVGSAAVIAAGRRWYRRVDLPPHELARLKWEQARAFAGAGAGAWHETEQKSYSPRSERSTTSR
ncbi:MAG TPA: hypothetical protein VGE11_19685 [Pseudonocardia sp.]